MNKKRFLICLLLLFALLTVSCGKPETPASADTQIETEPQTTTPETEPIPPEQKELSVIPGEYSPVPDEEYGLVETPDKRPCAFELTGRLQSSTGTPLNLYVDYVATREEGSDSVRIAAHLSIGHKYIVAGSFPGSFTVAGKTVNFSSHKYNYRSSEFTRNFICTVFTHVPCGYGEDMVIDVDVKWDFDGVISNRDFDGITLKAKIPLGEKYANLKTSVQNEATVILQKPELPEGCEVTSLAILLNSVGQRVSHTYLADNFLPQGEVGKTSFYEANVGNPRNGGRAYGCYAPVIVKTANDYLYEFESDYRAYDLTGYDVKELYYQLSQGHSAVTWITMEFADTYVKSPWNIDGEKLYWKYPLHCVVVTGYDMEKQEIYICDPLKKNPVTVDMELFEQRWRQMESQAVILRKSVPN